MYEYLTIDKQDFEIIVNTYMYTYTSTSFVKEIKKKNTVLTTFRI
jgi:hypothetical protein